MLRFVAVPFITPAIFCVGILKFFSTSKPVTECKMVVQNEIKEKKRPLPQH
jgi:hypothetical protein